MRFLLAGRRRGVEKSCVKPVVAVLAYRRAPAFRRLLHALEAAHYPDGVRLIISLEGEASAEVVDMAKRFSPSNLDVTVIQRERRLGLRNHVIACGDLALVYGAVIVLEDDLFVDPYFYKYASGALEFYADEDVIGGIALYCPELNEYANLPFVPMQNGYSTYLMQLTCSWGQCWSKKQWLLFKKWYERKDQDYLSNIYGLPASAKAWPESSWKKYFHGFLLETGRFVVYPYESLSTNCSDEGGEHIKGGTSLHQVCLGSPHRSFSLPEFVPISNTDVLYDAYMEPVGDFVWRSLGLGANEVEVDLQGLKPTELLLKKKMTVTAKKSSNPIQGFRQSFRPPEMNLNFPLLNRNGAPWVLTRSVDVENRRAFKPSLAWFNYYAGMSLMTSVVLKAVIGWVPGALFKKVSRTLRSS